eukprot:COSAG02_NODE_18373_length_943_cov_0.709716_1_plen_222_part_01
MTSQQWLLSSWWEHKQERPRHREDVRSHHALCWGSPGGLGDSVDGGCPGLCLRWRHLIYGIVDRQQPPQASQPPHSALSGVGSEPAHARTQADHGPCHPPPINTAGGGSKQQPSYAQPSSAQLSPGGAPVAAPPPPPPPPSLRLRAPPLAPLLALCDLPAPPLRAMLAPLLRLWAGGGCPGPGMAAAINAPPPREGRAENGRGCRGCPPGTTAAAAAAVAVA